VLNGRLELQGVDVEALAARALGDQLGTMGATLRHDDHEDALSYVIAAVWQASLKYDPERSISFSTFAYQLSRRRVSLLHLGGMPWARIGELVGHDDLMTTARTYTHVVADEGELNYTTLLGARD
jgi:integrase